MPLSFGNIRHTNSIMASSKITVEPTLLQQRKDILIETLSKARAETSDVTLMCEGVEFPAHKLVLEASSPYFQAMFHSGLEESKTGKVLFKELEPEILEIILNFLYMGDVETLTSEEKVTKILAASHLMQLKSLYQYCCDMLASSLTPGNFCKIWNIAQTYDDKSLLARLCCYWIGNTNELVSSMTFLGSPLEVIKDILNAVKETLVCWDIILVGLLSWLHYDVKGREKHVEELFDCIEEHHLSNEVWTSCLEDELNFYSEKTLSRIMTMTPSFVRKHKLLFFSDFCIAQDFDKNSQVMRQPGWCFVQQFEIDTMMWLPLQSVYIEDFYGASVALCQYKNRVCIIGGVLGKLYAMYDVECNLVEYLNGIFTFDNNRDAAVCQFKDNLYAVVKQPKDFLNHSIFSVYYVKPNSCEWQQGKSLKYGRTAPTILATAEYIYVIGGNSCTSTLKIEYSCCPETCDWDSISAPQGLSKEHFCVTNGKLHGLHCDNENLVWLTYDHIGKLWLHQSFRINPQIVPSVCRVCQFPDTQCPYVFFSTNTSGIQIPNFMWKPGTGELMKLPLEKGKCYIPDCEIGGIRAAGTYTAGL